jgi:hypothetical protein
MDENLRAVFAASIASTKASGRDSIGLADVLIAIGRVPGSRSHDTMSRLPADVIIDALSTGTDD